MTLREVAERIGCSERHVRRLIADYRRTAGQEGLQAINVGRGVIPRWRVTDKHLKAYVARLEGDNSEESEPSCAEAATATP